MFIEKRSIPKAIIYSIITCGIYAIYWMYKLTGEAHELAGEQTTATGGMSSCTPLSPAVSMGSTGSTRWA